MTRRTFRVVNIVEILIHWKAGRKKAEVARSLGVDRGTVTKYTAKALAEGYVPGGDQLSAQEWGALVEGWFPELVDPSRRQTTWPDIAPHHDRIKVSAYNYWCRSPYGLMCPSQVRADVSVNDGSIHQLISG